MGLAQVLGRAAAELALFAGAGSFSSRSTTFSSTSSISPGTLARLTVYTRYPRAFASDLPDAPAGFLAMFVPAWDESAVIASMLRATLVALPTTTTGFSSAITGTTRQPRQRSQRRRRPIEASKSTMTGRPPRPIASTISTMRWSPTSWEGRSATAVVLHDAEDVVHPLEFKLFDRLIGRAAVIQLPVPAPARSSLALDQWPLLRRIRRGACEGACRARGRRRRHPARRRRLRHRAQAARPACRRARWAPVRRKQHDRGL